MQTETVNLKLAIIKQNIISIRCVYQLKIVEHFLDISLEPSNVAVVFSLFHSGNSLICYIYMQTQL